MASVAVGIVGLAGFVLLQTDSALYHAAGGVPERIAVYTILLFELMLGATLLRRTRHATSAGPTPASVERTVS
jgi:hypothetical protein